MVTRRNSGSELGVPSGFAGHGEVGDFFIPSCNIEDVDMAIFDMFNDEIDFEVTERGGRLRKAEVIFAAGERFAMLKKRRAIRDRNEVLILPLISIRRTGITQAVSDMTDRGINQHTGDLTIKRRLSSRDRLYQQIINKFRITNQQNVAIEQENAGEGTIKLRTNRNTGEESRSLEANDGALLAPKLGNNIFEFITIPQPQFYTATYEITFNTSYMTQMNQLISRLMAAYLPQGRQLRLDTSDKPYWFVASFGEQFEHQDTFEDFSRAERVIMMSISCDVTAYMIHGSAPGEDSPFQRYVSAPQISFDVRTQVRDFVADPFQNADDPSNDFLLTEEPDPAQRGVQSEKRINKETYTEPVQNPFSRRSDKRLISVVQADPSVGEQVFKQL